MAVMLQRCEMGKRRWSATVIQSRIFPFALSPVEGRTEKSAYPQIKPFMLRQALHERLNLLAST
jgi:hypothetical protein